MALLINSDGETDLEQGLVEQGVEALEIEGRKREPIIAEHSNAVLQMEHFSCCMVIISIIFIFIVMWALTDSKKARAPIAFMVLRVATFFSTVIGIVIRYERTVHARRHGPALPIKGIMIIGNVLLSISEGLYMASVFAAFYLLVPFQLRWRAISVGLGLLVMQGEFLAILHAVLELRAGFKGLRALTCIALILRLSGLCVVLIFTDMS